MAFWKKSEDPWDIDPDERRLASEPAEKAPGLLDTLRGDWDAMQVEWQEKREKLRLPPEKCPWCGEDMEQGFLMSGRGVFWYRGIPTGKARWLSPGGGNIMRVDDDRLKLRPGEKIENKKVRFRTLGCYPLTGGIESEADTLDEIIDETLSAVSSERTSRVIDHEAAGSMERRKREGYF